MKPLFWVAILGVIGVAAAGTVLGVRALQGDDQPSVPYPVDEIEADKSLPRFNGELLGIRIVAPADPLREKLERESIEAICGTASPTTSLPWERAGELALSVEMPTEFVIQADDPNTGLIGCGDKAFAARWNYLSKQADGWQANLMLVRGLASPNARLLVIDAAAQRVSTIDVEGRDAVLISPVTANGRGSASAIVFPEPFGVTQITAFDLPTDQLLKVGHIVAAATK
jgi:hypothetical protein